MEKDLIEGEQHYVQLCERLQEVSTKLVATLNHVTHSNLWLISHGSSSSGGHPSSPRKGELPPAAEPMVPAPPSQDPISDPYLEVILERQQRRALELKQREKR